MSVRTATPASPVWFTPGDCRLEDFRAVVETTVDLADYPCATRVTDGVLVYEASRLRWRSGTAEGRRAVQAELVRALTDGPGVIAVSGAVGEEAVDAATAVFEEIVAEQKAAGTASGDHFAAPGANDRIWGALDKFALRAPRAFADYYAAPVLGLVAEAWLGPHYQVTSQVNVVNPGGAAQTAHRDYHLGFMDRDRAAAYPAHVHRLTPALTLQGAVAHCDMPVETGPTMYLPHSHKYGPGYLAYHAPEFAAYFDEHFVQLPLRKGDAAFFNPALFHGAGENRSSGVRRTANLLQVSSAFGRAMEAVDTRAISLALLPELRRRRAAGASPRELHDLVTVAAEGYPFPADLDRDQPVGGMAPPSQADVLHRAVEEDWTAERLAEALR